MSITSVQKWAKTFAILSTIYFTGEKALFLNAFQQLAHNDMCPVVSKFRICNQRYIGRPVNRCQPRYLFLPIPIPQAAMFALRLLYPLCRGGNLPLRIFRR